MWKSFCIFFVFLLALDLNVSIFKDTKWSKWKVLSRRETLQRYYNVILAAREEVNSISNDTVRVLLERKNRLADKMFKVVAKLKQLCPHTANYCEEENEQKYNLILDKYSHFTKCFQDAQKLYYEAVKNFKQFVDVYQSLYQPEMKKIEDCTRYVIRCKYNERFDIPASLEEVSEVDVLRKRVKKFKEDIIHLESIALSEEYNVTPQSEDNMCDPTRNDKYNEIY